MSTTRAPLDDLAERNVAYQLLAVVLQYAPGDIERAAVIQVHQKAILEGATGAELSAMVVNTLADGFLYDNWPWNTNPKE